MEYEIFITNQFFPYVIECPDDMNMFSTYQFSNGPSTLYNFIENTPEWFIQKKLQVTDFGSNREETILSIIKFHIMRQYGKKMFQQLVNLLSVKKIFIPTCRMVSEHQIAIKKYNQSLIQYILDLGFTQESFLGYTYGTDIKPNIIYLGL